VTCETPHMKYLRYADRLVGLKDIDVLEVGGYTPIELIRGFGVTSWTCLDLDEAAVNQFNLQADKVDSGRYSARVLDVAEVEPSQSFDLIYSINAFEHILNFETALGRMYHALRPGGYLFTLFGPIWSSDVGHHLSVESEDGEDLNFNDGVLAPWEHLTSTPEALRHRLTKEYGSKTAHRAVTYIFDYPDLNRLLEKDYLDIFRRSPFSEVLLVKRRIGTAPKIPGATNTREILVLLKKGNPRILEKPGAWLNFATAYLANRRALIRS
jgi:SAM-dependent methyltransferase